MIRIEDLEYLTKQAKEMKRDLRIEFNNDGTYSIDLSIPNKSTLHSEYKPIEEETEGTI